MNRPVLLTLPLLVSLPVTAWQMREAYLLGLNFVHGMHVFGWFLYGVFAAGAALVGLAISSFCLKKPGVLLNVVICIIVAAFASVLPIVLAPHVFQCGRNTGYARLDLQRLVESCRQWSTPSPASGPAEQTADISVAPWSDDYPKLPQYILSLRPLLVSRRDGLYAIRIDGGGPMYREGLVIAPDMMAGQFARYCRDHRTVILDPNHNVARYRFDDDSHLLGP